MGIEGWLPLVLFVSGRLLDRIRDRLQNRTPAWEAPSQMVLVALLVALIIVAAKERNWWALASYVGIAALALAAGAFSHLVG